MNDRDCEKCKHHTEKGCDSWDCNFEQGMKRKEIIEMLKVLKEQALKSHNDTAIIDVKKDSFIYVMDATINSLKMEQIEPCEDAISRQAVLDATVKINSIWNKITNSKGENLEEIILQLPPVNPQVICPSHGIDCEDCPAYEPKTDVLDKIRAEIEDLTYYCCEVHPRTVIDDVLDIIDKYKAESEAKND